MLKLAFFLSSMHHADAMAFMRQIVSGPQASAPNIKRREIFGLAGLIVASPGSAMALGFGEEAPVPMDLGVFGLKKGSGKLGEDAASDLVVKKIISSWRRCCTLKEPAHQTEEDVLAFPRQAMKPMEFTFLPGPTSPRRDSEFKIVSPLVNHHFLLTYNNLVKYPPSYLYPPPSPSLSLSFATVG